MRIVFNKPPYFEEQTEFVREALKNGKVCGDGPFTQKCSKFFEENTGAKKVLLTTSGTTALEMAALLCDIRPGDEVIMPSFTFSSTANAFVLRGATIVFVDVRPDTMNIDEKMIEPAITPRTKAIVPVHYAGVACEMDTIMDIARRHGLKVVEDAAQAVMSTYKGRPLGTIGDFGCYSFHETKNFSMGEGGALVINNPEKNDLAEIIWDCGTDRCLFVKGLVEKYEWAGVGSSYLPSDINAAYLYGQLTHIDEMNQKRISSWERYYNALLPLQERGLLRLTSVPAEAQHNAHLFYLILGDFDERNRFITYMKSLGISCYFHYVPLHKSKAGIRYGRFHGVDKYTSSFADRLVRLPMYFELTEDEVDSVVSGVYSFFGLER